MGRTAAPTQKPARRLDIAERRARVLAYFAEHPNASFRVAADAIGVSKSCVYDDFQAALKEITGKAREVYIASIISRNLAIVGACMPLILQRGSVAHGQLVLAADKRTAEMMGLDAPKRVENTGKDGGPIRVDVRDMSMFTDDQIERMAEVAEEVAAGERSG